jgi:hypothetical protein
MKWPMNSLTVVSNMRAEMRVLPEPALFINDIHATDYS